MTAPGTAVWFARHESRLAWRDWLSMITAGRRERLRRVVIAILVFAIFMHFVAYWMVGRYADAPVDKPMLVTITASVSAVVAVDDLAGHGIDDARVLCAL